MNPIPEVALRRLQVAGCDVSHLANGSSVYTAVLLIIMPDL
jgi:hypothetical protein